MTATPAKTISPGRMERLKRDAKRLRRDEGISHTEALERLAKAEGFENWRHLTRSLQAPT